MGSRLGIAGSPYYKGLLMSMPRRKRQGSEENCVGQARRVFLVMAMVEAEASLSVGGDNIIILNQLFWLTTLSAW